MRKRLAAGRRHQFERMAVRALDGLPAEVHALLENVQIVIEDLPTAEQAAARGQGTESGAGDLLGLYEGVPLTDRSGGDGMRAPDKITLFRIPLESVSENQADLAHQIRVTVVHEIGHFFGLDEDRLAALGYA